jgi:hypothetical protein
MQGRGSSLLHREAAAIRIILAQLGFPYHMTYAGPGLNLNLHISIFTRILQNMNRSDATREHSTPPPYATLGGFTDGYTLLSPSPHSQCVVVVSHNGIAKVLGLPEYVASTARSQTHNKPTTDGP